MSELIGLQSSFDLGTALKARRSKRAIKQEQLAAVIGVSRYTLVDLENGKSDPRLSTILKVADALGLKLALVPREVELQVQALKGTAPQSENELDLDSLEDIGIAWKGE